MSKLHAIVIGGGFAGLTAAVALTQQEYRVTLLERRNQLGGRARSFHYDSAAELVDNGQHVFLGCYRNTLQFLKTIGVQDRLVFQETLQLIFRQAGGIESRLRCPNLPAPWHLFWGLCTFNRLRFRDKWNALKVAQAIRNPSSPLDLTVTEWLIQLGQSPLARESLWNPMVIAALNESPDQASAASFLKVLQEAFAHPRDSRVGLASGGLSQLYAEPAYLWLKDHGAEIRLQANVEAIECQNEEVVGLQLTSNERLSADTYVAAIPPRDLLAVLPQRVIESDPALQKLHLLKASPILSINLWLDRPIFDESFIGLLGTKIHWIFNRSQLRRPIHRMGAPSWELEARGKSNSLIPTLRVGMQTPQSHAERGTEGKTGSFVFAPSSQLPAPSFLYSCVISAAYDLVDRPNEELITIAMNEIRSSLPEAADARFLRSQVIREPYATLSSAPDVERLRPPSETSLENLFLAGDWVQTGLPATIESAVASGFQATEKIITLFITTG